MTWSAALDSASPKPTTSMCCPFGSLNRWFRGGGRLCSCDLKYQKGSAKAPITHLRPLLSWLNYNSFEYSHHMGIKTPSSTQCSHTSKDGVCWGDLRLSWLIPHLLLIDSPFSLDTSINQVPPKNCWLIPRVLSMNSLIFVCQSCDIYIFLVISQLFLVKSQVLLVKSQFLLVSFPFFLVKSTIFPVRRTEKNHGRRPLNESYVTKARRCLQQLAARESERGRGGSPSYHGCFLFPYISLW